MKHDIKSICLKTLAVLLLVVITQNLAAQEPVRISIAVMEPVPVNKAQRLDLIGSSLEQRLVHSIGALPGVALVERNNLDALMKELELQLSGLLAGSTILSSQSMKGADYLVVSSYQSEGGSLVLATRAIRVSDGTIIAALGRSGKASEQALMEEQLGKELA